MKVETLKDAVADWSDHDYTAMAIAISLGLMTPETNYQVDAKHVFWSKNPIGDMLHEVIIRLVDAGVLEEKEINGDDWFRWNPAFKGTWEVAFERRIHGNS